MFYITQDGQIYSGDCQNNDRELTADEVAIIKKGVFTVVNSKIVDSTTLPEYKINNKISEINHKLQDIQEKLDLLDLKSIRALREGGENSEGVSYIDFYQNQINDLRIQYSDLNDEKLQLEEQLNDLTN